MEATQAVVTATPTTKDTYRWMQADAEHPRVKKLLEILQLAVEKENAGLEIIESSAEFTVQVPDSEKEAAFLFKAAANPETQDYHLEEWVKRGIDKLMGRKATRSKSPTEGRKRTKRENKSPD